MKHLKLFESNTNLYWIVLTHYKYSGEYYYDLFEDDDLPY